MSLRINTNIEAFNAHRQLAGTQRMLQKSLEKLSSGLRINRPAADAAGLPSAAQMRAQLHGLPPAPPHPPAGPSSGQTPQTEFPEPPPRLPPHRLRLRARATCSCVWRGRSRLGRLPNA